MIHMYFCSSFTPINALYDFRKDMAVKFPVITGESDVPASYIKTENTIRMLKWERTCIAGDIRREEELIKQVKANFQGQT